MKDLPDVCRLRILGFLLLDDLAEAAIVCKQFRDDCMHESLPQERTAVLRIPRSCAHEDRVERLRTRLVAMAAASSPDGQRKFHKFSRIRIVDPHRDVSHRVRWQRHYQRPFATTIPEITALDWSREDLPRSAVRLEHTSEQTVMAGMLPNLREVDFSWAQSVCILTLFELPIRCPNLEKVTWHGHWCYLHDSGVELRGCHNLRELYMDGACFNEHPGDLFVLLLTRLERVSIKGASTVGREEPIPQEKLVRFVRRAPNLRWFRSDLTPENVAMLERERPDVTLVT